MSGLLRIRHTAFWALLCLAAAADGSAQTSSTAVLKGRILDDSGDGLPGVVVTISNEKAAVAGQSQITDLEGEYIFRLLPPASGYSLKAAVPGYATVIAGPFGLEAGRTLVQNLTLKPSSELEETIKVEARGHIVDLASTKSTATYNAEFIEGLPLLGRRFNDILTLAPGVTDADGDGQPNVRGARDTGLQLRLDGTNITDPLTGHFGQDINLETIEELEIITSGAPAEYGRADGGFANVITKSGGNDAEGSFKIFYRSDFLDDDGVTNNDKDRDDSLPFPFKDTRAFLTAGGAFVKDHFWYFASAERLDREEPIIFSSGDARLHTQEGWVTFGKLTWQASSDNKLAFQISYDPLEQDGNFVDSSVPADSDYTLRTGGPVVQAKWTGIVSPTLLVEGLVSRLDGGRAIIPVSSDFQINEVEQILSGNTTFALFPCKSRNCLFDKSFFVYRTSTTGSLLPGRQASSVTSASGPYPFRGEDERERTTLKADLSLTIEDRLGGHAIKTGFEFNDERYGDTPIYNPVVTDSTLTCTEARVPCLGGPTARFGGNLTIDIFDPVQDDLSAEGLNAAAYVQDAWKPLPNLSVNLGLRFDHEEVDSRGYDDFNPLAEAREVFRRWNILCEAQGSACTSQREPGRTSVGLTGNVQAPPGSEASQFDLNGDGWVETAGIEGAQIRAPLTSFVERGSDSFSVYNANLAPRLSLSWDPWGDGRTKFFGTWNKYYDRLFLGTLTTEQEPRLYTAVWAPTDVQHQADPNTLSVALSGTVTISQIDRELSTPYTVEWSAGVERELAPEWALTLTYVSRRGRDLLQDLDVNHITCKGFDTAFKVDPMDVCGDGGRLEMDRFGGVTYVAETPGGPATRPVRTPNGAPDLYNLNLHWNQVLRTGNYNESDYTSAEVALRKRLHRNWQMHFSYTWSEAIGEAEKFIDLAGNDPAVSDAARGYLDYDQRHVLKWQGVAHLPKDLIVGGTIQWASGLPFSSVSTVLDEDDVGNVSGQRTFFVSGQKNDRRNEGQWTLNARVEKSLNLGRFHVSAFLSGENLMNSDDLRILSIRHGARGDGIDEMRRFGRRFELGASIQY